MSQQPAFQDLNAFLSPEAIAIVGASNSTSKIGAAPLRYLLQHEYQGKIFPVNRRNGEVAGLRSFPCLKAINQPVDLAIFALPASGIDGALDDAIAANVKNIVVFSAGFAETGPAGQARQQRFTEKANAAGIRVLGPNCLGFMNISRSVYATFSPVVSTGVVRKGNVGLVSQSGAFGAYAYAMARERGIGLSSWITTGNEADISVADCIAWMANDAGTQVIMAYLEGCKDGGKLKRALQTAHDAGKPVVVVKVGRTTLGARTAASHTATLAGDDAAYDALMRQYGAWRARSIEEFFDIAHSLAVAAPPSNQQVGILTVSGGVGAMIADDAAEAGLQVEPLPSRAQLAIRKHVPFAATANPVDITGQVTSEPALLEAAARIMLGDGNHGSLLIFLAAFGGTPAMRQEQQRLAQALRKDWPDRLLIFCTLSDPALRKTLQDHGCLFFEDPSRAIRVLAAFSFFLEHRQANVLPDARPVPRLHLSAAYNEAQALSVLAKAGIPVNPVRQANSYEGAEAHATELGYPVVLKVLSADVTHKSDIGGVALNIQDRTELALAYQRITRDFHIKAPGAKLDGVLVTPMIAAGVELILGARNDPTLGPVLML